MPCCCKFLYLFYALWTERVYALYELSQESLRADKIQRFDKRRMVDYWMDTRTYSDMDTRTFCSYLQWLELLGEVWM